MDSKMDVTILIGLGIFLIFCGIIGWILIFSIIFFLELFDVFDMEE